MRWFSTLSVLLAGCHWIFPYEAPECCLPWPDEPRFETPVAMAEVNSPDTEGEPFLTRDQLTLFFFSNRPGGPGKADLYRVTRPSPEASFGPVQRYDSLNTEHNEYRLVIAADDLTAYLTTDRPGGAGGTDIWVGSRESPAEPFASGNFRPLSEINSAVDEHDVFPSHDNLRLYFCSSNWFQRNQQLGPSLSDLLVAERASTAQPFGPPVPIPGVNDPLQTEGNPVTSPDELLLLFNSARPGSTGGSVDIWYTTRTDRAEPFLTPRLLPDVNSTAWEANLHLTEDGRFLYFCRGGDIYSARLKVP